MKEGQCSGRKGPGKGRSPAAARAPLSGPEREGRRLLQRLLQRLRPPSGHGTSGDDTARHPGPSAVYGCGSCSLNAPFLDPRGHQRACTGKRPVSRGEAHSAYTAAVMRLHSLQVCASSHAARPGCYSAPPLSHTHSRREPGEGGD